MNDNSRLEFHVGGHPMLKAKDFCPEGDDREAWDRAWRSMPHRRLALPTVADITAGLGPPVSATISLDPPEFSHRAYRESETCPICRRTTRGLERLAAHIHPTWANRLSVGIGVWVHRTCFEDCAVADIPAPIPW